MRLSPIAFSLAALLAACGTDPATTGDDDGTGDPGGGNPGGGNPGGGSQDPGGGTMLPPPARGFQVVSTPVTIPAGKEITYCYYFKTSNTTMLPIQSWKSHMSTGSHHMILYFTNTEEQPAGTITADGCGGGGTGIAAARWTYASQIADQEFQMPGNDGTGLPIAQLVPPGQPAYIQMHYLNVTDHDLVAHVELNANAYADGTTVRGAAPFITYKVNINIDAAQGSKASVTGMCSASSNLKFFTMSTHVHKQGVHTAVKDGSTMVFQSDDWEHPGSQNWDAAPFFSFSSGTLTNQCDYINASGTAQPIVQGPSAATNEMCMAVGYFFDPTKPSVNARTCLN